MLCRNTVALALIAGTSAFAADWPRWRGPAANGVSSETVAPWSNAGPRKLWQAEVGLGFSSISVAQGRAYTMGFVPDSDVVTCLDAITGNVLWKHADPGERMENVYEGGPNATPTVDGGTVFTFTRRGNVSALDAATGKLIWQRELAKELGAKMPTWGFSSSPLVEGGIVIPANKNLRAQFTPPVVLGGYIYGMDGNADERATLRCMNPANGKVKWTGPVVGTGGILAANGRLVVLSDRGELALYDASPAGFKVLSRVQILGGKCWTNPALSSGRLYARNAKGTLVCYELTAGQ